jgi:hypothetical protein
VQWIAFLSYWPSPSSSMESNLCSQVCSPRPNKLKKLKKRLWCKMKQNSFSWFDPSQFPEETTVYDSWLLNLQELLLVQGGKYWLLMWTLGVTTWSVSLSVLYLLGVSTMGSLYEFSKCIDQLHAINYMFSTLIQVANPVGNLGWNDQWHDGANSSSCIYHPTMRLEWRGLIWFSSITLLCQIVSQKEHGIIILRWIPAF